MPDLRSVTDETKWRLAARCAARLPAMYDAAFRERVGDDYDKLEQEIWMELARLSLEIARTLQLPVRNAAEVAKSLLMVNTILFGPDYKGESIEVGDDGGVIIVRRCPFLAEGGNIGIPPARAFHRCMAFTLTSQNNFNPKFSSRFVRAMCMGDRQCEIKVETDKEEGKKPDGEKPAA